VYTDLIIAEIHQAINKLGGSARPVTPGEAQRALRDLSAEIDLRSIVDSWQDTLPDEHIRAAVCGAPAHSPPERAMQKGATDVASFVLWLAGD
jgi:hypothetical protein